MRVVQIATGQDVGRVLHPIQVIGQIEGGIAQGVGLAVMEEIVVDGGLVRNPSFTDYLIPTIADTPEVLATCIEQPEPGAPFGAKGVGEPPTISSTAAVAAAIRAATGVDVTRVPGPPVGPGAVSDPASRACRVPASAPMDDGVVAAQRVDDDWEEAGPSPEREVLTWERFGTASRELAPIVVGRRLPPDVVIAIARGGLTVAGALAYALGVKNCGSMNVEFYTGVDERLDVPVVLPPTLDLVDVRGPARAGGRRRGRHRPHAAAGARGAGPARGRGPHRRALPQAPVGGRPRLRLARDRPLDRVPVVGPAPGGRRARRSAVVTAPAIDAERLLADLEALAAVGDTGDGGNCRLALTDEDAGGRELVVGWMRDLGLDVRVDRIGNVVATRAGTDAGARRR